MKILKDVNDIFTIDDDKLINDILYIKKHFKQGLKYLFSDFLDNYEDIQRINLNISLNHIDGGLCYYIENEIGLSSTFRDKYEIESAFQVEAIEAGYNNKFNLDYDFDNIWIKPFHFNFDSLYQLLKSSESEDTYLNFNVERTSILENTDFNKIQFEEFYNKINSIKKTYEQVSDCLFIGNEILSEKQPYEIHYYKNKNFCLLQEEEFDFCDSKNQLPDFMNKAIQLYFIFSNEKDIIVTKDDNQLYNKLIISDVKMLNTLKDKYLLDSSFKNSTSTNYSTKRI